MTTEAYKDHRAGSAKGKVHKAFDKEGPEAAIKLGKKLKKADTTVRTWMSEWRNAGSAKKAKAAKAGKKTSRSSARKPVKAAKTSAKKPAKKAAKAAKPVKRERITEAAA